MSQKDGKWPRIGAEGAKRRGRAVSEGRRVTESAEG
jgi:hypothetical protein